MGEARAYLETQQERIRRQFKLGSFERYDWDPDTGMLTFSHAGVVRVAASFQFVGTTAVETGTWLWAWANPSIPANTRKGLEPVRRYGCKLGFPKLCEPMWYGDEEDAWSMTAAAAFLTAAKGAYRSPDASGNVFMVFTDIAWVE